MSHIFPDNGRIDEYGLDEYGNRGWVLRKHPPVPMNKEMQIRVHMHYSDPDAKKSTTVFGAKESDLHYDYNDRLYQWNHKLWDEALKVAEREVARRRVSKDTALFFEIALSHFFAEEYESIDVRHILIGCNWATGYDYLVFGYRAEKKKKPKTDPQMELKEQKDA